MPPIYTDKHIRTGIHDFKTHIARYIRELESGQYEQLLLTARGRVIGGFYSFEGQRVRAERARLAELSGLLGGSVPGLADLVDGPAGPKGKG
jgi:hypothetical protein